MKTVFSELTGKTLVRVSVSADESEVRLHCECGQEYLLMHHQSCCEDVYLEEVVGDFADLLGHKLLLAEEVSDAIEYEGKSESGSWTFYKLATIKGAVTLRWLGESNAYYSVDVSVHRVHDALYLAQQHAARLNEVIREATVSRSMRRL